MERAGPSLCSLIKELGIEEPFRVHQIKKSWDKIFDEPLRGHMSPVSLNRGELLIHVDSPVWLQQITFYKADIIKKLSGLGVADVRFKTGRVERKTDKKTKTPEAVKLSEEDVSFIDDISSSVCDEGLRENIRRALEKSIAIKTKQ